jgi:hypothetical protein
VDDPDRPRTYFTVVDENGTCHPAVSYLAATLNEEPVFQVMPLKRYIRLIGSGEHLEPVGDGRFVGASTRRTFSAPSD